MNGRDRVFAAIEHNEPDRVPRDYWAPPEVTERLCSELHISGKEMLLQHFGVDLRYVEGPSYVGQDFRSYEDGSVEDLWGVRRQIKTVAQGAYQWRYKFVVESPLAHLTLANEVDAYEHWPSADWWDYSRLEKECERHRQFAVVNAGDRLDRTSQFKTMMYLRGMEQAYIDLVANQKLAEAIIGRIRDYFLEYNERVFRAARGAIDIFMMGDDFGTQNALMMNRETWRKLFRRGFRQFIDLAHSYDIKVMHHTCGAVSELMPEFIDAGLDILQSLQPRAAGMELSALKKKYGKNIAFHGGIDIQESVPRGTPEQIRAHVRQQLASGMAGGGYIVSSAHNIPAETPTENIVALYDAYDRFGKYL